MFVKRLLLRGSLVGLALLTLASCTATTTGRTPSSLSSLDRLQITLSNTGERITETSGALADLAFAEPEELPALSAAYTDALEALDQTAATVKQTAEDVDRRAASFFRKWKEEISSQKSARITSMSASREEQVEATFQRIRITLVAARDAFLPYRESLGAIATDLTSEAGPPPGFFDSLQKRLGALNKQAAIVSTRLTEAIDAIDDAERLWDARR